MPISLVRGVNHLADIVMTKLVNVAMQVKALTSTIAGVLRPQVRAEGLRIRRRRGLPEHGPRREVRQHGAGGQQTQRRHLPPQNWQGRQSVIVCRCIYLFGIEYPLNI